MTDDAARYTTENTGRLDRVRLEAHALRLVMDLDADGRAEACANLEAGAWGLPAWLGAVRRELAHAPNVGLSALWAILDRPNMTHDRQALADAGVDLSKLQNLDPKHAQHAYAEALEAAHQDAERASIQTALAVLADAAAASTPPQRRALRQDAIRELTRTRADGLATLSEAWDLYRRARFAREQAGPDEVLRLDPKRGAWADNTNAWLGPRAGLEPGRCVIIGARPGAGKTSLAALFAVDALAAGVPVLFWQLELSREETLEHLLAQVPGAGNWWSDFWTKRCNRAIPSGWNDNLTVPAITGPEAYEADTIRDAMLAAAHRNKRPRHAVRGLVVVDYAQLLTVRDKTGHTPQHEVLTKAASMLTKTAADNGLVLLLLSQLTKEAKKNQTKEGRALEETALSGADLSRMAHVVFGLSHAALDAKDGWTECGAREVEQNPTDGEARLLSNIKSRGFARVNGRRPEYNRLLWVSDERALHNGSTPTDTEPWDRVLGDPKE